MNTRIAYLDIMRPFAESVLLGWVYFKILQGQAYEKFLLLHLWLCCDYILRNINKRPAANAQWIYNTPVHSDVEAKLRQLLVELGNNDKILGIQVCTLIL